MTYDVFGTILTDPTITIRGMNVKFDDGTTEVDVLLDDGINDAPITLTSENSIIPIPATTQINAIKAWVNNKLEEFEV